jgi:hypothetical protein
MLFRSLAIPAGVVLVAALMADRHDEFGVEARTPAFFRRTSSQLHQKSSAGSSKKSLLLSRSIIDTLSRGGAAPGEEKIVDDSDTTDEEADAEAEVLYLPGLLEVALTPADQVSVLFRVVNLTFRGCVLFKKKIHTHTYIHTYILVIFLTLFISSGFILHIFVMTQSNAHIHTLMNYYYYKAHGGVGFGHFLIC